MLYGQIRFRTCSDQQKKTGLSVIKLLRLSTCHADVSYESLMTLHTHVFGRQQPFVHLLWTRARKALVDIPPALLSCRKKRGEEEQLNFLFYKCQMLLCKAKGFTARVLGRTISLITDLLIHVL